jgi:hypothetical protein
VKNIRIIHSVLAGGACFLSTFVAQAAPTVDAQSPVLPGLQLTAPRMLAQGAPQPAPANGGFPGSPAYQPVGAANGDAYFPPQSPPPYAPAPAYAPPMYAPPAYPPPPYYPQVDSRPATLSYSSGMAIPPGYRLESYAHKGFVVSGSIMFGISYVLSMGVAGSTKETTSSYDLQSNEVPYDPTMLYIPVAGPWLALGTLRNYNCSGNSSSSNYSDCQDSKTAANIWKELLIIDGIFQVWGAAFVVLGVSWRWQQLELTENVHARIVPVRMGASGQGLAMVGTFAGM